MMPWRVYLCCLSCSEAREGKLGTEEREMDKRVKARVEEEEEEVKAREEIEGKKKEIKDEKVKDKIKGKKFSPQSSVRGKWVELRNRRGGKYIEERLQRRSGKNISRKTPNPSHPPVQGICLLRAAGGGQEQVAQDADQT